MKRSRFSEEQIIGMLREQEAGKDANERLGFVATMTQGHHPNALFIARYNWRHLSTIALSI